MTEPRYATEISQTRELLEAAENALRLFEDRKLTPEHFHRLREIALRCVALIWSTDEEAADHDLDGRRLMTDQEIEQEAER